MNSPNLTSLFTINITSNTSSAVALTTTELWIQMIVFYGFLCGTVATICSILIWIGIWRKKNLRTRFFIIIACLTFCRTGLCLQFLIIALFRSLRTAGIAQTNQMRLVCHFVHFWIINGFTLELTLLCTLVIDRMIAIIKTNYYRMMSDHSAFYVCAAQYVIVNAIKLIPSYLGDDMMSVVPCINLYSFLNAEFNEFSSTIDFVLVGLILVLYFILIIFVHLRVKALKASGGNDAANMSLQRQLKLMPILRNLVVLHCGLSLSSKVMLFIGSMVPVYSQRFTALGGYLSCLDLFVNVVSLLVTNAEVRNASLPCGRRVGDGKTEQSNGVTTMTTVTTLGKGKSSSKMYPADVDDD